MQHTSIIKCNIIYIYAALPEGFDLKAETIFDLLEGVCGMLLAGKIVSVVGAKGATSLDTT